MRKRLIYLSCLTAVLFPAALSAGEQAPIVSAPASAPAAADLEAIFQSAKAALHGTGAPRDPAQAFALMKQAAEGGHAEAAGGLGYLYSSGIGTPADAKAAVLWFRKGAEKDSAKAQFNLGRMLITGRGVEPNEQEGWQWWEKAAQQGLPEAQMAIADSYYFGQNGQARDFDKAYPLYREAAERGSAAAQNFVGVFLRDGLGGIKMNREEARAWFAKAAAQEDPKGLSNLGQIIFSQPKDSATRIEGLKWLLLAEQRGEITAINSLNQIVPKLSPAEVSEARKQAAAWGAERSQ